MKNFVKEIASKSVEKAFTSLNYYQPKVPASLMKKIKAEENKKD